MTVYLGKNPVGVGRIVEKKVAKTKFGATIDNFLGDVDADGNYIVPSEPIEINLAGVKAIKNNFGVSFRGNSTLKKFVADDLISVSARVFVGVFEGAAALKEISMNGIETIDQISVFENFCYSNPALERVTFAKLKEISGVSAFSYAFSGVKINPDETFPLLETIVGNGALNNFSKYSNEDVYTFSKVKKINGASTKYTCTFGSLYVKDTVWNFPSATEFTGYIFYVSSSTGEIHFAAANQAAIEACEGYDYKWGFQNATIYFDL